MKYLLRNNRSSHIHLLTNDVPTEILLCRVCLFNFSYPELQSSTLWKNSGKLDCRAMHVNNMNSQIIFESFEYFYSGITSCRLDHSMEISFNFDIIYKREFGGGDETRSWILYFSGGGRTSLLFKHLFLFLLQLEPPMCFRTYLISHTKRAPLNFVH